MNWIAKVPLAWDAPQHITDPPPEFLHENYRGSFCNSCQYFFWSSHPSRYLLFSSLHMIWWSINVVNYIKYLSVHPTMFQSRYISFSANLSRLKMSAAVRRIAFFIFACVRWIDAVMVRLTVDLKTLEPHSAGISRKDLIAFDAKFTMRRSSRAEFLRGCPLLFRLYFSVFLD